MMMKMRWAAMSFGSRSSDCLACAIMRCLTAFTLLHAHVCVPLTVC
jgi:hypothetical protein